MRACGRHQQRQKLGERDRRGGGARHVGKPVRPAHHKPKDVAHASADVIVLAAGARQCGAEFGLEIGSQGDLDGAEHPQSHDQADAGYFAGDKARRAQDAGADDLPDGHGDAEGDTEDLQKMVARLRHCGCRRDAHQPTPCPESELLDQNRAKEKVVKLPQPQVSAWSRSAIRSSASSTPQESRTSESEMPRVPRCSAGSRRGS